MPKSLNYYAQKFAKLRVDRARGIAPHKPILLLSVIDLVEQGMLRQNRIFLSPELIATFLKFWSHLGSESHRSDIAQPFFYTRSEGSGISRLILAMRRRSPPNRPGSKRSKP